MRFTSLAPLAALLGTASTATALVLPWGNHNEPAEIPSLSVSDWQKVRAMGFDQVQAGVKLADDFVRTIVNDVEEEWKASTRDQDDQLTIWQLLNNDKDRYSKLLKAIEIEGGMAKKILDDRDASITFFAPENSGIPDPHHGHHDDAHFASFDRAIESLKASPTLDNLLRVHELHSDRLFNVQDNKRDDDHRGRHGHHDKDDEEKKKRIFKFILGEILKYHGLPQPLSATELANNKTVATALHPKFGANDGQPLRIHLEKKLVPPSLELNFYAKVVATHSDRKAINGYLHEIDHPLLPPPSVLDGAFFARELDTFTTAIQKIHEEQDVAWEFSPRESKEKHHPIFRGTPAVTAFLPTTDAFKKLPEKLQFFLFSPFGNNAMRRILGYHLVKSHVIFTESIHKVGTQGHRDPHHHDGDHKHHHHDKKSWLADELEALWVEDDSSFHLERNFSTILPGTSVQVTIDKSKVVPLPGASRTTLKVNGIEAEVVDGVALNGAVHVLPEVLTPPHEHHDEEGNLVKSSWDNWEQWLVQWANAE